MRRAAFQSHCSETLGIAPAHDRDSCYVDEYGADWGAFAAGPILVSLPVMALFLALQRYFVEGLTAGSVKG